MATLKAVVRKQRADGFFAVYIRIVHRSRMGYIKTDKVISPKNVSSNGELKDPVVNEYCSRMILKYTDMLNRKDLTAYSVAEVIEYLTRDSGTESFSEYARLHIDRMTKAGHGRNAKDYMYALQHLERYLGTNQILFAQLSSTVLKKWIETMSLTNRAKEKYPICLRQIFKAALVELNDEEKDIIRIKFNPWLKVQIPKSDKAAQRAISAEACREFFNRPLPQTKMLSSLPELGRDVAMLVLCLGGINTADLYALKKVDYRNGVIGYKRAKLQGELKSSRDILNIIADILYKASEVFRRAIEAIIHFATEQHKSIFSPSEAADIKSVMQSYGETTEQQKAVGTWLCDYAEHRQPFDEIKHRHTLNEIGDVAEGRYDWKIDRGRGGISL